MGEIIKLFGTNLKVSGILHSIPLEWFCPPKPAYSSKLLRPINDIKYTKTLKRKSFIATATLFIILCQGLVSLKNSSIADTDIYWLVVIFIFTGTYFQNLSRTSSSEFAVFINALIQFDFMYQKQPRLLGNITAIEFLSSVFVQALFLTEFIIPAWAVFVLNWNQSWKISLAGYWLIPNSALEILGFDASKILQVFVIAVVLVYNFWMFCFVFKGPTLVVSLIQNLSVTILIRYLHS